MEAFLSHSYAINAFRRVCNNIDVIRFLTLHLSLSVLTAVCSIVFPVFSDVEIFLHWEKKSYCGKDRLRKLLLSSLENKPHLYIPTERKYVVVFCEYVRAEVRGILCR